MIQLWMKFTRHGSEFLPNVMAISIALSSV